MALRAANALPGMGPFYHTPPVWATEKTQPCVRQRRGLRKTLSGVTNKSCPGYINKRLSLISINAIYKAGGDMI